jgi:hypothetical protein
LDEIAYPLCAKNTKRISYRYMKDPFIRNRLHPRPPFVGRPQSEKHFMAALGETVGEVNNVLLSTAKFDRRRDVQNTHRR